MKKRWMMFLYVVLISLTATAQEFSKPEKEVGKEGFKEKLLACTVFYTDKQEQGGQKEWNAHPLFKGVYLKHLVAGSDTKQQFSYHLVKVEPNCCLDEHLHNGKFELHQVVAGSGRCLLDGKELPYAVGVITVIPPDSKHRVEAGANGLYLLATFVSAL